MLMCCYLQAVANGAGTCTATAIATAVASSTGNTCSAQVSLPPPPYIDSFLALQQAACAGLICWLHLYKACCNCAVFVNAYSFQCPGLQCLHLVCALPFGLQASATATATCFSRSTATAVAQSFAQAASTAQGGFCAVAPIFAQSVATAIAVVGFSLCGGRPQIACITCCLLAVNSCLSHRHRGSSIFALMLGLLGHTLCSVGPAKPVAQSLAVFPPTCFYCMLTLPPSPG